VYLLKAQDKKLWEYPVDTELQISHCIF
jgi:hypothetical protein